MSDEKDNKAKEKTGDILQDHPILKSAQKLKSNVKDIDVPKGMTGFVEVEFLRAWGGRKKGDKETYHVSTAKSLIHHEAVKVLKHIEKYVPKKAKE